MILPVSLVVTGLINTDVNWIYLDGAFWNVSNSEEELLHMLHLSLWMANPCLGQEVRSAQYSVAVLFPSFGLLLARNSKPAWQKYYLTQPIVIQAEITGANQISISIDGLYFTHEYFTCDIIYLAAQPTPLLLSDFLWSTPPYVALYTCVTLNCAEPAPMWETSLP